jgi:hypothetical protein
MASRFDDETIAQLVNLATIDWMSMGALSGEVGRVLGSDASVEAIAKAIGELAGILIDHGVLPGELGTDPDFQPWSGTRADMVARIVRETIEIGGYPWPDDIAWFHRASNEDLVPEP